LVILVLAAAFSCLARNPRRVGVILSLNVVLHLLLDGLQTKWGNGVVWGAPFDWGTWNLGWFWPESPLSYSLAATGLVLLWLAWRAPPVSARVEFMFSGPRAAAAASCCVLWLALPAAWQQDALAADVHGLLTLASSDQRTGRAVAFDRTVVTVDPSGTARIQGPAAAEFICTGVCPPAAGHFSLRGTFRDPGTVSVDAFHRHRSALRDAQSYVGLLGVMALWLRGAAPLGRSRAHVIQGE
jgi:hypothetical protein